MKTGIELITEERIRQIEVLDWTAEHDEQHEFGELALAACCYASPVPLYRKHDDDGYAIEFVDPWPDWDEEWDKRPRNQYGNVVANASIGLGYQIRNLVKAGSLIAAEIDRLQRLKVILGRSGQE